MNIKLVKDTFSNKDNSKTFYVVRYVLMDKDNNIVRKGDPIIWLTKEQYNSLKF